MGRFCISCGAAIDEDAKCCISCGIEVSSHVQEYNVSERDGQPVKKEVKNTASVFAESTVTNMAPAMQSAVEFALPNGSISAMADTSVLNIFPTLINGVKSLFGGFKNILKNKKRLIAVIVLALVWVVLLILQGLGINPFPVKLATWLTFAQGGVSNNIIRMMGGVLGKGVFASCFIWLLSGGYKNIGTGLKVLGGVHKQFSRQKLVRLLMGAGAALIIYNFMAGYAAFIKTMVGVAAFLLILRALGNHGGFVRKLAASLTAEKKDGIKTENTVSLIAILQGFALGFAISVPLSLIPWGYIPYCLGLAVLIAGGIVLIVFKCNKGGAGR